MKMEEKQTYLERLEIIYKMAIEQKDAAMALTIANEIRENEK